MFLPFRSIEDVTLLSPQFLPTVSIDRFDIFSFLQWFSQRSRDNLYEDNNDILWWHFFHESFYVKKKLHWSWGRNSQFRCLNSVRGEHPSKNWRGLMLEAKACFIQIRVRVSSSFLLEAIFWSCILIQNIHEMSKQRTKQAIYIFSWNSRHWRP